MTPRVLVVAADARAAKRISVLITHAGRCRVSGWAPFGEPATARSAAARPDAIVLDGDAGADLVAVAAPALRAAVPSSALIALASALDNRIEHLAALDAVVLRRVPPPVLATLVAEIAAGTVVHPRVRDRTGVAPGALTTRELEILQLVAAGASNAGIAGRLWVTEQTVKFHLSNVYRKLGVANRTQASHYAHTNGLVAPAAQPAPLAIPEAA